MVKRIAWLDTTKKQFFELPHTWQNTTRLPLHNGFQKSYTSDSCASCNNLALGILVLSPISVIS